LRAHRQTTHRIIEAIYDCGQAGSAELLGTARALIPDKKVELTSRADRFSPVIVTVIGSRAPTFVLEIDRTRLGA
jgi:hypothetical protein